MTIYRLTVSKIGERCRCRDKAIRGTMDDVKEWLMPNMMCDEEAHIEYENEDKERNVLLQYEVQAFWNWNGEEIEFHMSRMSAMGFGN